MKVKEFNVLYAIHKNNGDIFWKILRTEQDMICAR